MTYALYHHSCSTQKVSPFFFFSPYLYCHSLRVQAILLALWDSPWPSVLLVHKDSKPSVLSLWVLRSIAQLSWLVCNFLPVFSFLTSSGFLSLHPYSYFIQKRFHKLLLHYCIKDSSSTPTIFQPFLCQILKRE